LGVIALNVYVIKKSMQLLYITSSRIPGERAHSIQIIKTVDALLSKGVRTALIAPRRRNPFAESIHDLKKFYGLNNNINIIRLPTLDVLFAFRNKKLAFILINIFFCVWLLPYILFMRIFCRNLVIFIREQLLLILIGAFSSFLKLPLIYELHNIPSLERRLFWIALRRANAIITICDYQKLVLVRMGFSGRKIFVVRDAFDDKLFKNNIFERDEARSKLGLPLDRKIVAYTGQLSRWKKPEFLLDAAKSAKTDKLLFLFVGGGKNDISRLKKYLRKQNIDNVEVIFAGFVPHARIPLFLCAADILVHYTPWSRDSLVSLSPLKLFEYMAVGRPILAPDQPPIREVIRHGYNGLLFDSNDPSDLAAKIDFLLSNQHLCRMLGENALKESCKYTYDVRAGGILSVVDFVLEQGKRIS